MPESPRWLFIHGREEEAERDRRRDRGRGRARRPARSSPEPEATHHGPPARARSRSARSPAPRSATTRGAPCSAWRCSSARRSSTTRHLRPRHAASASSSTSPRASVPFYIAVFAVANFLGPLHARAPLRHRRPQADDRRHLPRLGGGDRGARRPAARRRSLTHVVASWPSSCATFFLASAGASSAYLTVSEIFPMETRALAIAFFYAVGTAAGGITGPLLFGHLIDTGRRRPGRDRLLHRRRGDGDRRHRRAALRRQGRAGAARGHRRAADRRGGRAHAPSASARGCAASGPGPGLEYPYYSPGLMGTSLRRPDGGGRAAARGRGDRTRRRRGRADLAGRARTARCTERDAGDRAASGGRSTKPSRPAGSGVPGAAGTKRLSPAPRRYARRVEVNRDAILAALEQVIDPELQRPVTELDMVRDIEVAGRGRLAHDRPHDRRLPAPRLLRAAGRRGARRRPRRPRLLPLLRRHDARGAPGADDEAPRRRARAGQRRSACRATAA